jgi:inner membrane protein
LEKEKGLELATPIGHALAGYAVYCFFAPQRKSQRINLALLSSILAVSPDLDFLPGILIGRPAAYHQGITHSIGFAIIICSGVVWLLRRTSSFFPAFVICFLSYLSHLILDFFGPDNRLPYGIPLFWPITQKYFISPVPVFLGVHHAGSTSSSILEWGAGMFSLYNLGAIALEVVIIVPLIFLGRRVGGRN